MESASRCAKTILAIFLGWAVIALSGHAIGNQRPIRVVGGGESTTAAFVEYVGHDGEIRPVPSIGGTIGNRITFGFNATESRGGRIEGQMQLVDHVMGMVVNSDVVELSVPHPVHGNPVGTMGLSASMKSSTESVTVNGEPRPGWKFVNSPLFDGGEGANGTGDTICFELFDEAGVKILQWSAFLSSGNVRIQE